MLAAQLAAFALMRPRPPLRAPILALLAAVAVFLPQFVLVVSGDNGQLDWIPAPTPTHVAIGAGLASLPRRAALALAVVLAVSAGIRLGRHYVAPGKPLL